MCARRSEVSAGPWRHWTGDDGTMEPRLRGEDLRGVPFPLTVALQQEEEGHTLHWAQGVPPGQTEHA